MIKKVKGSVARKPLRLSQKVLLGGFGSCWQIQRLPSVSTISLIARHRFPLIIFKVITISPKQIISSDSSTSPWRRSSEFLGPSLNQYVVISFLREVAIFTTHF